MTYRKVLLRNGIRLNYIDTNVIISFLNIRDVNHARAVKVFDNKDQMITSPVTVLEIKSVLSRSTNLSEDEIEAFIDYLPEINVAVPEVNMDKIINNSIEIAVRVRMKTLDILHISASMMLEADTFVTFDSEFTAKEKEIANFGLRIDSG